MQQYLFHLFHGDLSLHQVSQRGNPPVLDSTGMDEAEAIQISVHVKGEAMKGNPPLDSNTNGHDLILSYPDSGESRHPLAAEAVIGENSQSHLFQLPAVEVDIFPVGGKIQDGIGHHLPRSVEGHVPPTVHPMDADFPSGNLLGGNEDMILTAALAQSEDGLVLHQEQEIRNGFSLTQSNQILLQRPNLAVGAQPQVSDPQDSFSRIHLLRERDPSALHIPESAHDPG